MKKQRLLLVLILAFFAGISSINAACLGTGFTPAAGVPYTYVVDVSALGAGYTGIGTFDWYVTQNVDILDAGAGGIIPAVNTMFTVGGADSPYHVIAPGAGTTKQITLTWTPAAVASGSPFYLVLRYTEANTVALAPGCSAENIRVWQIQPINTFLLAVEPATNAGVATPGANSCAPGILTAVVTPNAIPASASVEITYGESQLYYRLTASGILGEWRPSIHVPALAGLGQNYVAVEWNSKDDGTGTWHTFNIPAGSSIAADGISTDNATVTDAAGTAILVRLRIANDNYEHLTDQGITVGVDGYLPTAYTVSDIWGGVGPAPDPCAQADPFAKTATYTILHRPTPTPGPGMPAFIQKLP
ncbi:MAG: hypothetical protein WCR72_09255 [Bacteroidota bacterium]